MKPIRLTSFLAVAALLVTLLMGATHYREATTLAHEGKTNVIYKVVFDMTSDSTGTFYSKAMFIGDMNDVDGRLQIIVPQDASGTEDIDYTLEYSVDGNTWSAQSADDELTQVTAGTVNDTLGIVDGVDDALFHSYTLLRLKAVGQTGNPLNTITHYVILKKDPIYYGPAGNFGQIMSF